MRDAVVKMRDGTEHRGSVWDFNAREGYMTLTGDAQDLRFAEMESASVDERVGIRDDGNPRVETVDLLARARDRGWDGT